MPEPQKPQQHQQQSQPQQSQQKKDDDKGKEGGGGGKGGGGGNGGGDDPVKTAAQAIVDYASDPAMLGPNQQLRDMVEALKKALEAGEQK